MEDILRRLGNVETGVTDLKTQIARIEEFIPTLATAESVSKLEAVIPHLATKADLFDLETKIIKWMIATVLAASTAAFSIAKFVH